MDIEIKRISEWARELKLPLKTLRKAASRGQLAAKQLGRGTNSPFYATRADIEAWLNSRTIVRRAW